MVDIVRHQPSSALSSLVPRRKVLCDGRHGFKSNAFAVDFPELHSQRRGQLVLERPLTFLSYPKWPRHWSSS